MRTSKLVLLVIGVLVLVVAAIWRPVVAPQLTKLPTSLDVSYRLAGTYTGYVNPSTGARLAGPQNLPLSIDRNLKAVPAKSIVLVQGAALDTAVVFISPTSRSSGTWRSVACPAAQSRRQAAQRQSRTDTNWAAAHADWPRVSPLAHPLVTWQ
jgi:hypothetical protein